MLKITRLNKRFGGVKAVDSCSFSIKENRITALIGPNGSGKSTLFNLVSRIIDMDSGHMVFGNSDISGLSAEQASNLGISRLFQKSQLFSNLTVRENLLLAIDNEDTKLWKSLFRINHTDKEKERKIKEILRQLDMESSIDKLGRELSYGQKRLVELARAALKPHRLLMLDEPIAGVSPRLRSKISDFLRKLKEDGATVLLIEHDMNFALNLADDVIVMDKGKVIAHGTPKRIKHNRKVLEAYLGD